ncbi:MAG: helix-turn-helix domain-containing protein, partial [Bacteroidales bacterium]|nr:helix-turn-helix domain-containing protein [Bacteroidales bacterium]
MNYIKKISDLMRIKKITQNELSQKIGRTRNTVNNWFKGHTRLDVDTMLDIAEALGVHPCVFFKDIIESQIAA